MDKTEVKCRRISGVVKGSCAEKAGIIIGDCIKSINGEDIEDVFDYRYGILSTNLNIDVLRDGKTLSFNISKDEEEDLGLEFEEGLMDEYKRCHNNCIFCFIDQMPPGMRETLYFKDDDSRLSFLQGNYVTLTNLTDKDVERIIRFKMSPINISFQTTNPELRCKMLNNRFAGESLSIVNRFYEAGITMNGQIVLCKGVNDGKELERSIEDLYKYAPVLESVSVVPVGITKFREGLYPLESFDREDAIKVIDTIEEYQKRFYDESGLHFVHASDEWYIKAGREVPDEEMYDGYLQLENGVGMLRLLCNEFTEAFNSYRINGLKKIFMKKRSVSIATGKLAFPYIKKFADMVTNEYPKIYIKVYEIPNRFFGENITVSGLITGQDIVHELKDKNLGDVLLLPCNMLKADEAVFLDDMSLNELSKTLQVDISIVKSSGYDLFMNMMKDGA